MVDALSTTDNAVQQAGGTRPRTDPGRHARRAARSSRRPADLPVIGQGLRPVTDLLEFLSSVWLEVAWVTPASRRCHRPASYPGGHPPRGTTAPGVTPRHAGGAQDRQTRWASSSSAACSWPSRCSSGCRSSCSASCACCPATRRGDPRPARDAGAGRPDPRDQGFDKPLYAQYLRLPRPAASTATSGRASSTASRVADELPDPLPGHDRADDRRHDLRRRAGHPARPARRPARPERWIDGVVTVDLAVRHLDPGLRARLHARSSSSACSSHWLPAFGQIDPRGERSRPVPTSRSSTSLADGHDPDVVDASRT